MSAVRILIISVLIKVANDTVMMIRQANAVKRRKADVLVSVTSLRSL